jgi:iron complex transport system permease protein
MATMCLIYALSRQGDHPAIGTLLMTGLALTAFVGGFSQLLSNLVDDATLRQLSLWHMGGLSGATQAQCALAATVTGGVFLVGKHCAQMLDALALGESQATSLGVELAKLKRTLVLTIAVGVGVSVTLTGTIAFVGLVVPHIMRQLLGPSHRQLVFASCLAGALLLLVADTTARCILAPTELPVGALTTLLGAPFFLALLLKRRVWLSDLS